MQKEELGVFLHVGLTVSDLDKTIEFYERYFGFKTLRRGTFSEDFIGALPQLYKQPEGTYADFAFVYSPDGCMLELFQFNTNEAGETICWNRPGYHHICLKVKSVQETYERMKAEGIEFYFPPRVKGEPQNNEFWTFLKDPDGNMVELQD